MIEDLAEFAMGPAFEKLSRHLDVYCPFEAMGVARYEIRHSNFLADVIDPLRPHGFGDTLLRAFLGTLLKAHGDHETRLALHLADLGRVTILREWKHIDLVVDFPDAPHIPIFVVEIKVEAREHGDQLAAYEAHMERSFPDRPCLFFFLSPNGTDASSDEWVPVSFEELLLAFEEVVERSVTGNDKAQAMLASYISMVRRRYVPDEKLEELARQLWTKHSQALEYLVGQRPNVMRDVSQQVQSADNVAKIIRDVQATTGLLMAQDSSSNTYFRFYVPAWAELPDMMGGDFTRSKHLLLLEAEVYGERIHVRMILGRGEQPKREALYQRIMDFKNADTGRNKKLTGQYTRLASKTIKRVKDIDERGPEELIAELVPLTTNGIVGFASKHLPTYDAALRGL